MQAPTKLLKFELVFVFLLFVLTRLPSLGYDTFNTDSWKWKARIYNFGSGVFNLKFADTIQRYHPGVTLMWVGTASIKAYNLYYDVVFKHPPEDNAVRTIFEINFAEKLFIVVVIGLTLTSIYLALITLFGRRYAFITLLLIYLEPFYTGLTREIHLEGLLTAFIIASFVWLFYYLESQKNYYLGISALFGALAFLTKTTALFIVPFAALVLLLHYLLQKRKLMVSINLAMTPYFKWLVVFLIAFVMLWPAMWVVPEQALQALYKGVAEVGIDEGHDQLYYGQLANDPGPGFYFVVIFIKSSFYLLIGVVGYLLFARKAFDKKTKRFVLFSLLFAVLYFIELTIPSKKIDRYVIPSMLSLLFVAGFFYEWILIKTKKFYNVMLVVLFIPAIIIFVSFLPDYFSYYNPLSGGLKDGIYILEPKWLIGGREITAYFEMVKKRDNLESFGPGQNMENLLKSPLLDKKLTVGFPEKYYTQIWPFIKNIGGEAVIRKLTGFAIKTKYFVFPVWQDEWAEEDRFKLQYDGSIYLRGVEVYRVYKRV